MELNRLSLCQLLCILHGFVEKIMQTLAIDWELDTRHRANNITINHPSNTCGSSCPNVLTP